MFFADGRFERLRKKRRTTLSRRENFFIFSRRELLPTYIFVFTDDTDYWRYRSYYRKKEIATLRKEREKLKRERELYDAYKEKTSSIPNQPFIVKPVADQINNHLVPSKELLVAASNAKKRTRVCTGTTFKDILDNNSYPSIETSKSAHRTLSTTLLNQTGKVNIIL